VLPSGNRLHRSAEFRSVVSAGRRARRGTLVLHHLPSLTASAAAKKPAVGLVVGKLVGSSVVRHRLSRRLRAQLRDRLDRLPAGSATVVRALPAAASASFAVLGADLDAALSRVLGSGRGR
jgi:ribonuclease P protein component